MQICINPSPTSAWLVPSHFLNRPFFCPGGVYIPAPSKKLITHICPFHCLHLTILKLDWILLKRKTKHNSYKPVGYHDKWHNKCHSLTIKRSLQWCHMSLMLSKTQHFNSLRRLIGKIKAPHNWPIFLWNSLIGLVMFYVLTSYRELTGINHCKW